MATRLTRIAWGKASTLLLAMLVTESPQRVRSYKLAATDSPPLVLPDHTGHSALSAFWQSG